VSAIIRASSVRKDYVFGKITVPALKGVDVEINAGEFLAISGPSGSGKTTLLNIIGCIERASAGDIVIEGQNIDGLSDNALSDIRLNKIGFIFQQFNLIPVLTARENVEYPLLERKMDSVSRRARVEQALMDVGLDKHAHHRPLELSGGQRQRVAIARAMAGEPLIILADEPTANLDKKTGADVLALMQDFNRTRGVTFVFSTHDPNVIDRASRVINLSDGLIC
jgi:putative ABC transport system ATP-binding protein